MRKIHILGIKVNMDMGMKDVLKEVQKFLNDGKCHYISTTNPEFVETALNDNSFKDILNKSDLSLPDGSGLLYADYYLLESKKVSAGLFRPLILFARGTYFGFSSLIKKYPLSQKITGVDLMNSLCSFAEANNKTVFLLGGWPKDRWGRGLNTQVDLAKVTADELKKLYPRLRLVGATSQFSGTEVDDVATLEFIHQCMKEQCIDSLDFLFVAYGHPKQEKFIVRNMCDIPAKLSVGVGGTFDYISKTQNRSPQLFIDMNLEWLYKLITQSWRIKRIFSAYPVFPLRVYLDSIKETNQLK
jgi:N-acetylglucosaminyldiphosphoundecaprenol N-acetyl-beta-D-mannosaminyltransferase